MVAPVSAVKTRSSRSLRRVRAGLSATCALACALAFAALPAGDARADGTDVAFRTVLVIDASSSMRRTDPGELRKVAAELFVDMARDGDRIAVTGFDGSARQSTGKLVTIDGPHARAELKRAIRAVGNDGDWTDFTAGLEEARRVLAGEVKRHGDQDLIVFLTDGRCEPDPDGELARAVRGEDPAAVDAGPGQPVRRPRRARRPSRAERAALEDGCRQRVLEEQAAALAGARVYAIGLSRNAPADFLDELGRRTGGRGEVTLEPVELPRLFADVYARLLGSRLQEGDTGGTGAGGASGEPAGTFEVYQGARTLDLVIVSRGNRGGRAGKLGTLRDPGGGEIAIDNREPARVYFASSPAYRFYKIAQPAAGRWTIEAPGVRFAALQHFDLRLDLVDPPEAVERGQSIAIRARLASPGGVAPPAEFLAKHAARARLVVTPGAGGEGMTPGVAVTLELPMELGPDGVFRAEYEPELLGAVAVSLVLEPLAGGVLSRETGELATIMVVPPVRLEAAPIELGRVKQGARADATLDLAGSEVGVDLQLAIALALSVAEADGDEAGEGASAAHLPGHLKVTAAPPEGAETADALVLAAAPGSPRSLPLSVALSRDAPGGPREYALVVAPVSPAGLADRAVVVPVRVEVVPLTFWERYGTWVKYGAGGVLAVILLLGVITPARFKKRAILYYCDVRDPDLPRRSSYPLGARAKRGFYRPARVFVGPSGPVKRGGPVQLVAVAGGRVEARLADRGAIVYTVRKPDRIAGDGDDGDDGDEFETYRPSGVDDADADADRPRATVNEEGAFRLSPGCGYEIRGSGFVFWYE